MRFENRFDVDAPLEEVWEAVLDVQRVAPTVPGAQVLEQTGDDAYMVAIKVKVGPMSITYRGNVEIVERDEAEHRAVMKARAKEARGQGTADADVVMLLRGEDGRTSATVTTDVDVTGKVASMGRGVLQDVAGRLVETFAKNLAAMLEGEEAPEPVAAGGAGAPARPAQEEQAAPPADTEREGSGTPPPPPPRPTGAAPEEDALDLGALGGAVVADQLKDPRKLAGVVLFVALVAYLLGRRSGA